MIKIAQVISRLRHLNQGLVATQILRIHTERHHLGTSVLRMTDKRLPSLLFLKKYQSENSPYFPFPLICFLVLFGFKKYTPVLPVLTMIILLVSARSVKRFALSHRIRDAAHGAICARSLESKLSDSLA